jgi:D-glycero-alpha-D-manno-heptose-7-phosphate kinase
MLVSKTPFRISIGGGGTDVPSYYERFGGELVTAAINRHVYVSINRSFSPTYFLKYSQTETCEKIDQIRHPIIREALRLHPIPPGIEITTTADIPAGTGLGSSGSFTSGLLNAIFNYNRTPRNAKDLAEEACHIEIDILREPIGKQDQYAASFGGLICMSIDTTGAVKVSSLAVSNDTFHDLQENLLLFFTGFSRSASIELKKQDDAVQSLDSRMIDNLHYVKDLGRSIRKVLEAGQLDKFAALLHEHWIHKQGRTTTISNSRINYLYDLARKNGALGGKLVGAGGGGFLLFYCEDKARLRQTMRAEGLVEERFSFDVQGSSIILRD